MKKIYSFLLALSCVVSVANAQSQLGEIRGKVLDSKTKKPMDFVSIVIELNGITKATVLSDDDGSFIVKTLQPGNYTIKASNVGYRNAIIREVNVISDEIAFQNISMESNEGGTDLADVVIIRKRPLVDPEGKGGATKTAKEIMALPQRNPSMVANTVVGVDARNGSTPNFRGARADGTAYYIDGVRVQGGSSITVPQNAIDQIQVITGGTPAQYGDFIGGAIAINTKAPSRNWNRSFEYITASPFTGYLDNTHYNEFQGFVSGPIKIVNKGKGDKERVLFGFSFAGAAAYARDPGPSAVDIYKVNDNKLREIQNRPLVPQSTGGFIPAGEYLLNSDLEKVTNKQNAATYRVNAQGNFSFQPASNISVRLGYQAEYANGRIYSSVNSLTNYEKNALRLDATGRVYLQFTQTFSKKSEEDAKKSLVSNAFYTVRIAYENRFTESQDADFGTNYFQYGYLGKFNSYTAPSYTRVSKPFGDPADQYRVLGPNGKDSVTIFASNYLKQNGYNDTLLTFEQANTNTVRGNYTREIFDYTTSQGGRITSISNLRGVGGLLNGDQPNDIYSILWRSPGNQQQVNYQKSLNETVSLYVMSEASVAPRRNPKSKHDLQFGLYYEQQFRSTYTLGANGLYTLMRLLANTQFVGLDSSKAMVKYNENGVFNDTVQFLDRIVESNQSNFDKNLRDKLISLGAKDQNGKSIDQFTKLNPNSYDPSMFSLNMFTADELLNNGNSYVNYYGYDYMGNKVNGKPGIDKFLNDPRNRTIGAFQPIYTAAWLQDKFVFKDLIVRMGVRMERFDANQIVLKDPYSLAPIYTAGDVKNSSNPDIQRLISKIPGSIGNDYAVYVDDDKTTSQLNVSGFRSGNNWFDKNGNPVTDPNSLWKASVATGSKINRNTPLLVNSGQKVPDATSFKDYTPDVKFLPRIWFSFPISTTSQFFGTYDVLAQRPSDVTVLPNAAQIDDYYYLNNRQGGIIANPDLKMTQVTDYEIGFRQQIGTDAALGIKGSYREFRNLIQQYQYVQAWPYNYITYGNIDFSTVKSISVEYELRDIGNINLSASYMLQFADGTGSNAGNGVSPNALIAAGQSNQRNIFPMNFDTRHTVKGTFDYHYKEGKEYNGPIVGGKKIFQNAGFNIIFNSTSGRPYTQTSYPTPDVFSGVSSRSQVKGTRNGANLPSQFYADINIDKYFTFKSESLDGKTTAYRLRVFLWVQNLFNNVNVLSVYTYTGSAYSDGFITSTNAEATLRSATNAQSLVDLYNTRVVNPDRFALPRLTRLGIALYF